MKKILILSAVLILVGAGCNLKNVEKQQAEDKNNGSQTSNTEILENTNEQTKIEKLSNNEEAPNTDVVFQKSEKYGYYGNLELEGYMEVVKPGCGNGYGVECLQDYSNFVVVKSDSPVLFDYLKDGGNFKTESKFQLGCYKKGISIESFNLSDKVPGVLSQGDKSVENKITGEQLTILENSNKDNLVKLKAKRDIYTFGMGVIECYSHFKDFEVYSLETEKEFNNSEIDVSFTYPAKWGEPETDKIRVSFQNKYSEENYFSFSIVKTNQDQNINYQPGKEYIFEGERCGEGEDTCSPHNYYAKDKIINGLNIHTVDDYAVPGASFYRQYYISNGVNTIIMNAFIYTNFYIGQIGGYSVEDSINIDKVINENIDNPNKAEDLKDIKDFFEDIDKLIETIKF